MILIFLFLLFMKNNYAFVSDVAGKSFKWDKFVAPCENEENTMGNFSIANLKPVGKNITFDLSIYIDQLVKKSEVEISFVRCTSRETLDTCRLIQKLRARNGCFILTVKHQIWTPTISCLKPKVACPLPKGAYYYGEGCALDFTFFNFVPLGRYYWKVRGKLSLPTGETVLCSSYEGQLINRT